MDVYLQTFTKINDKMTSINRLPPYVIVAAVLFMITFYHVYNVRQKNSDLERNVKIYSEALSVSKEKNKVLVKDALEKIEKKDVRIKELEKENLTKHTRLGVTQTKLAKIRDELALKQEEIKKLHDLAADHKSEITTLTKSVSKSKEALKKLSEKAKYLMLDHKKLKQENFQLQQQNEKLENEIKQHKLVKKTLEEQNNVLAKQNQDLSLKVSDLTKKNEMIQESIRQKIKESYAARRMMTPWKPVSASVKVTEDKQINLRTSPVSAQNIGKDEHKDSSKETPQDVVNDSSVVKQHQVPNVVVDNSNNTGSRILVDNSSTPQNVSNFMVDNSISMQNNVSKVLVNKPESKKRGNIISDSAVNDIIKRHTQSLNAGTMHDKSITQGQTLIDAQPENMTSEEKDDKDVEDNAKDENINEQSQNEGESEEQNEDVETDAVTSREVSESLSNAKDDENVKNIAKNANANKKSQNEEESEQQREVGLSQTRTQSEKDSVPSFPKIEDETIDRQSIQSQKEYGNHLRNNHIQSIVSNEET